MQDLEVSFDWRAVIPVGGTDTADVTSVLVRVKQTKVLDLLSRWSAGQPVDPADAELMLNAVMAAIVVGQETT